MKISLAALSGLALTLAPSASATVQQICSGGRANICLSVGINNARTLYLQIKAPASNGWAAIGTGSRMVGSKIFVLYRNTRGGLTVSPREAGGYSLPGYDDDIEFKTLNGTGIFGNEWVANIECTNCLEEASTNANGNANFIYASNPSDNIRSDDLEANFRVHQNNARFSNNVNLPAAFVVSANPFQDELDLGNRDNGPDGNDKDNKDKGNGGRRTEDPGADTPKNNGDGSSNNGSGGNTGGSGGYALNPQQIVLVHGILMALAFLVLFPIGAFLLRLPIVPAKHRVRTHYIIQLLAFVSVLVSFGLIINQSTARYTHLMSYHHKLGFAPPSALIIQVILGVVHHMLYKKKGSSNGIGTVHVWLGRITLLLGFAAAATGVRYSYEMFFIENNVVYIALLAALLAVAGVWVVAFLVGVGVRAAAGKRETHARKY